MGQHDVVSVGTRRRCVADIHQKADRPVRSAAECVLGHAINVYEFRTGFVSFANLAAKCDDDELRIVVLEQCPVSVHI